MSTVPKITETHWLAASKKFTTGHTVMYVCNKAIEIALAEQQESEYITAAQARELGAGNAEYSYSGEIWDICDSSCKYSITHNGGLSMTKYRAIKQAQPEPVATIKLDGNMVTPEQAAAEWENKKETHDRFVKWGTYTYCEMNNNIDFVPFSTEDFEYELRAKPASVAAWTGSREDVIALLKEMELL